MYYLDKQLNLLKSLTKKYWLAVTRLIHHEEGVGGEAPPKNVDEQAGPLT